MKNKNGRADNSSNGDSNPRDNRWPNTNENENQTQTKTNQACSNHKNYLQCDTQYPLDEDYWKDTPTTATANESGIVSTANEFIHPYPARPKQK